MFWWTTKGTSSWWILAWRSGSATARRLGRYVGHFPTQVCPSEITEGCQPTSIFFYSHIGRSESIIYSNVGQGILTLWIGISLHCWSFEALFEYTPIRQWRLKLVFVFIQILAPEVMKGGPYGHAADWWSLGILASFLLCGKEVSSLKLLSQNTRIISIK